MNRHLISKNKMTCALYSSSHLPNHEVAIFVFVGSGELFYTVREALPFISGVFSSPINATLDFNN